MIMIQPPMIPKRIAITVHPAQKDSFPIAEQIKRFFDEHGAEETIWAPIYDETLRRRVCNRDFELMVALGGDGTMLRAGHLCAPVNVPILGINAGRFGFLMEIQKESWQDELPKLLNGQYWLEKRMMLHVSHLRGEKKLGTWEVLNEAVVCRGQMVRPITLKAWVDGHYLTSYLADGLIAATPTGSTAYALAVNGPIMPPELRNILIVPVAPHLSVDRSVILSEGAKVTIEAYTSHQAVLSVDGQSPVPLKDGDKITVEVSENSVYFIRLRDPGYFYENLTKFMKLNPVVGDVNE